MNNDILGSDLRLIDIAGGKDLTIESGDIGRINGRENLAQALTLRLLVSKGGLAKLGHPDYGSRVHELIGEPNNEMTRGILKLYCKEAILQEPRVKEIKEIKVIPRGRERVDVHIDIIPIDSQTPLNLVVAFDLNSVL